MAKITTIMGSLILLALFALLLAALGNAIGYGEMLKVLGLGLGISGLVIVATLLIAWDG